jgi:hypothetical protein
LAGPVLAVTTAAPAAAAVSDTPNMVVMHGSVTSPNMTIMHGSVASPALIIMHG